MLRKRLKILHITKSDFKSDSISFTVIRQYGKGFAVHISTVFERVLSCCLSKGAVKRHFLDIFLTLFLGFQNFVNTLAMRVVVFLKMFKTLSRFQNCRKKIEKKVFVSDIIAIELFALNCLY